VARIRNTFALLREQLWIVPLLPSALVLVLAHWLLTSGAELLKSLDGAHWWLYSDNASTARGLPTSLLPELMAMTSLIISVTCSILALAANHQLGLCLISIVMGDIRVLAERSDVQG